MARLPAIFVGHGAPTLAIDAKKGEPLATWGASLVGVRAILVVSAHWERSPPTIGTRETAPLVYDFYGFPAALNDVTYAAPGAPELADRVGSLVPAAQRDDRRGLDHGVWTPLVHMFPRADVPILQLSLPSRLGDRGVLALGRTLAPLRDEGVLIIGSGNITHNLHAIAPEGTPPASWASDFDAWTEQMLLAHEVDALAEARVRAPAFSRNHPTADHWLPLLVAVGAASDATTPPRFPVLGWELGNLSRRAVELH
jgi:4,5-DOPA dioxygenase extradiol